MDYEQNTKLNEAEPEQLDGELCKSCGQALIDKSENQKSVLCSSCREKMICRPIPKAFIIFAVIIAVTIGAALYRFPKVLECYRIYHDSPEQAENGEIADALTGLQTVIEKYPDSTDISVRAADLSMNAGYYDYAGYVIDTYLSNKKMDQDTVDRINKYFDRLNRYFTTSDAMKEMESKTGSNLSQEEIIKRCHDYIESLFNDPSQDKALLYYYLSIYSDNPSDMESNLENCLKEDDTFLVAKVDLSKLLRRQGDLENAEKFCNEVLTEDKYNSGALRSLSIIRLLQGKKEEGLDIAQKAFSRDPEGLYVWETYIIALNENTKLDEIEEQIQAYLAKGNTLDQDTTDYLAGNLSLHDYYID